MTVAPVAVHGGEPPLHNPSTKHNPLHHFSPISIPLLNRSRRFHNLCVKVKPNHLSLPKRRRFGLVCSLDSDIPNPLDPQDNGHNEISKKSIEQWDSLTAEFAGTANLPFLLLQLPQIVLNARNLIAGNNAALFAVPWLGMFTGLLGNLSLLSYFAKKGETEAMVVQTLGIISTYAVITQLAMAGSMPNLPPLLLWSSY